MIWLAVAAGGALGSAARHGVNLLMASFMARPTPYATAAVNLIGTGIIGILAGTLASGGTQMTPTVRAFIFIGVLGGFTTFSSYMLDTLTLAYTGERMIALVNVLGQTLLGVAAIWAGYSLGLSIR
jgi:fluoride exporter